MAWWKPSYDPGRGLIWQALYRPAQWNDGDTVAVTSAHWTRWTRHSARARVHVIIAGERGIGTVVLSHPGFCQAIHRRAFLRMRESGGPWGNAPGTEDVGQSCAAAHS